MTPVSYSRSPMIRGSADTADMAGDGVADAFVAARRDGAALTTYPGPFPQDLAAAYAIQDRAIRLWGDRVIGGWKVGRINAPDDARLGADRIAGPIFSDSIVTAGSAKAGRMPIFRGGFAAGEGEFMLRLAPREGALPTSDRETLEWIDAVRIGIEVASSPYARINADGPCVTVSDHGNNAGLVLGAAVPAALWGNLTDIRVTAFVDGESVGAKTAASMLDGPLGAVRFLLANLAARGLPLSPGTWVSSGAVTGVHEIGPGQTFRAEFDGIGAVECAIAE
jgi:2-keto-4-pentenoate hydratase